MDLSDYLIIEKELDEYRRRVARQIALQWLSIAASRVTITESRELMARIDTQLDQHQATPASRESPDAAVLLLDRQHANKKPLRPAGASFATRATECQSWP